MVGPYDLLDVGPIMLYDDVTNTDERGHDGWEEKAKE